MRQEVIEQDIRRFQNVKLKRNSSTFWELHLSACRVVLSKDNKICLPTFIKFTNQYIIYLILFDPFRKCGNVKLRLNGP